MINVTIKSGRSSATQEFEDGTTVGSILSDANLMTFLGAPENAKVINAESETLDPSDTLADGDVIYLERQASAKAL